MGKINMNEKINLLSFDRELVSEKVSNTMINNMHGLLESIKFEEKDEKTIETIAKAKAKIEALTLELVKCIDTDTIIKKRNSINYYINKIKGLTNIESDKFDDNLFLFRDDIKEFVRISKRRENMNMIILTDYQSLSKEEKSNFSYEMSKERKFTKRINEKYNSERVLPKKNIFATAKRTVAEGNIEFEEIEPEIIEVNTNISGNIDFEKIEVIKEKVSDIKEGDIIFDQIVVNKEEINSVKAGNIEFDEIEDLSKMYREDYVVTGDFKYDDVYESDDYSDPFNININTDIIPLIESYKLEKTNSYKNSFITNIKNLFTNIPHYLRNKKAIKKMEKDYSDYYQGKDLFKLIKYSKYDNSFRCAFGEIFKSKSKKVEQAINSRKVLESIYDKINSDKSETEGFKELALKGMSI